MRLVSSLGSLLLSDIEGGGSIAMVLDFENQGTMSHIFEFLKECILFEHTI